MKKEGPSTGNNRSMGPERADSPKEAKVRHWEEATEICQKNFQNSSGFAESSLRVRHREARIPRSVHVSNTRKGTDKDLWLHWEQLWRSRKGRPRKYKREREKKGEGFKRPRLKARKGLKKKIV